MGNSQKGYTFYDTLCVHGYWFKYLKNYLNENEKLHIKFAIFTIIT